MSILLTFIRTNQSTHSRVSCGQWFCLLLTWFIVKHVELYRTFETSTGCGLTNINILTERVCAVRSESEPQLRMTVLYKISERNLRIVCRACGVNLSENQHILDEIERLKTKFYTVQPTSKSAQCHLSVDSFTSNGRRIKTRRTNGSWKSDKRITNNTFKPGLTHQRLVTKLHLSFISIIKKYNHL